LVIFRGKTLQQQWFPPDLLKYDHWNFTASPNGWTNNTIVVEWLKKIFIPSTKPQDPQEAKLLIFDGYRSHESTEFIFICFENNIHLLFLPPHSSHVLQPLDISIFSPFKRAYRKYLGDLGFQGDSTVINKRNFVHCYERARNDALTSQNIRNGWKGIGLWLISMTKPLMSSLLLENRNSAKTSKNQGSIINLIVNTLSLMSQSSIVAWSTLRKA
jgi:4-hydroxybenzoate polyprenyltransferase